MASSAAILCGPHAFVCIFIVFNYLKFVSLFVSFISVTRLALLHSVWALTSYPAPLCFIAYCRGAHVSWWLFLLLMLFPGVTFSIVPEVSTALLCVPAKYLGWLSQGKVGIHYTHRLPPFIIIHMDWMQRQYYSPLVMFGPLHRGQSERALFASVIRLSELSLYAGCR